MLISHATNGSNRTSERVHEAVHADSRRKDNPHTEHRGRRGVNGHHRAPENSSISKTAVLTTATKVMVTGHLLTELSTFVLRLLRHRCIWPQLESELEDMKQEVLLRLLKSISNGRIPELGTQPEEQQEMMRRWASGIVRHVVYEFSRAARRRPKTNVDDLDVGLTQCDPISFDWEQVQRAGDTGLKLASQVLRLRYDGLRFAEIAAALNKSEGAVKSAYYREIRRLQERYRSQEIET